MLPLYAKLTYNDAYTEEGDMDANMTDGIRSSAATGTDLEWLGLMILPERTG
jgi:hypothetical protein